jgi:hypothetical protein
MDPLTSQQRSMLDFEHQWWQKVGAKETAIRELFGVSTVRYYQLLNQALTLPAALRYDPVTVNRLRRIRSRRNVRGL